MVDGIICVTDVSIRDCLLLIGGGWYDRPSPSTPETAFPSDYVVANASTPHEDSKQPGAFREKALPVLPSRGDGAISNSPVDTDYFSNTHSGDSDEAAGAGAPVSPDVPTSGKGGSGVTRKTSLYKKVKGLGAKVASR